MTSAVNAEHLCFTLKVIRKYSFVYITDNQEVYISVFNLKGKKKSYYLQGPRKQYVTNAGFLLFFSVL